MSTDHQFDHFRTLELRPADARIDGTEKNAREVHALRIEIGVLCMHADVEPLTDDQVRALWCPDIADAFGMLDDLVGRCGCDEERMEDVAIRLYNLLCDEDQRTARVLDCWGII